MFKSKAFWIASLAAIVAVLVYRGFAAPAGQTTQPPKKISLKESPGDLKDRQLRALAQAKRQLIGADE